MHPQRAANAGGRDVVQRRHRRIAGGRDVEREIRAQCLVEWIVERRLRAASRGGRSASTRSPWSGGTGQPSGNGPKALNLPASSIAPCASKSNAKLPERRMNWMSLIEPSR